MTTSEANIVSKYTSEIEVAAGEARTALVNELYQVLAMIEKRITLSKVETAATSFVSKVEGEIGSVVAAVEHAL